MSEPTIERVDELLEILVPGGRRAKKALGELAAIAKDALSREAVKDERIEVLTEALNMLAGMNAPCQPWCSPHRDKDGCTTDEETQTMGPCVPNFVKFAIAEAKRRIAERQSQPKEQS